MKRFIEISIIVSNDVPTLKDSIMEARKLVKSLGLEAADIKPVKSKRTISQNNSLHLFFSELADELNSKGMDMRAIIREEVEISWTPYSVKEYLWRPLQRHLLGKKSTTTLDKLEDINIVYDNLNRILSERTKGEVTFPRFPSIEYFNG